MVENLPLAACARIARSAGVERIGNEGKIAFADALEAYGGIVAAQAASYASHAKRKTVTAEDIALAVEHINQ